MRNYLLQVKNVVITLKGFLKLIALLIAFALPLFLRDPYLIHILIIGYIFGGLAASYDIISGYIGVLSFGPSAFFGLGAYGSALLAKYFNISPYASMFLGAFLGAAFGLFAALPCLRLKLFAYTAIATWGLAEILRVTFAQWVEVTRGYLGLWGIPPFPSFNFFGITVSFEARSFSYYYLCLILLLLILWAMYRIVNSPIGLKFIAVRDDDVAAETLGVDVNRMKYLAFFVHGFTSGIFGAFYAHYLRILTPDVFSITVSTQIFAYELIGGAGTLIGPVLAGIFMVLISESMRIIGAMRLILIGSLIIIVIMVSPKGLVGIYEKIKKYLKIKKY